MAEAVTFPVWPGIRGIAAIVTGILFIRITLQVVLHALLHIVLWALLLSAVRLLHVAIARRQRLRGEHQDQHDGQSSHNISLNH